MLSKKTLLGIIVAVGSVVACSAQSDVADDDGSGTVTGAWDAESVTNESDSTHLWIVNRSLDIMGLRAADPAAKAVFQTLNTTVCRDRWQQGLFDADFLHQYNNGTGLDVHDKPIDLHAHATDVEVGLAKATWESHFFDPDPDTDRPEHIKIPVQPGVDRTLGINYKGFSSPTALTEAEKHLAAAYAGDLKHGNATACYELGLALHYFTDLTQPMHAMNFTATMRPVKLHSDMEGFTVGIQDRFKLGDWTSAPTGDMHKYIVQTARDSKGLFGEGVTAVHNAWGRSRGTDTYHGTLFSECKEFDANPARFLYAVTLDVKKCWNTDPEVIQVIGKSLESAQDHTAKFLYLVGGKMAS